MTWEEYRHRSQLLQAISLLSETDQPISETAAQCGFESPSGFAKAFRLAMGEAPRDYRVRVFQGGTDAVTRVLIEFGDGNGDTWSTVGVSGNIIDASFQALVDAITYRLLKVGVAAQ